MNPSSIQKQFDYKKNVLTDIGLFEIQLMCGQIIKINNNQMCTPSTDFFYQVCSKVANKLYFEQLMAKQQQYFDIQPYKIDKLYSQSAKKIYKQICFRYQTSKQLVPQPNLWHQNQRKIFTWFIVCYFHEIGSQNPLQVDLNWDEFTQTFFGKSSSFLKFQFLNIIKIKKRILWTNLQDTLLAKATQLEGVGKWNQISKSLFFDSNGEVFKTPKHCRQRWLNHLDGNKNKGKWTNEEDYKIFAFVSQNQKKWSKIVQVLNYTRTQHMVKNRFNSLLTKNRRNKKQKQTETINKILRNLENTFIIAPQPEGKLFNYVRTDQAQLQNNNQSGENDGFRKNNLKIEETRKRKFIHKKSSFEFSSFQTMPLLTGFSFTNIFQNYFSGNQVSNRIKTSESMFYQIEPNFESQKNHANSIGQFSGNKIQPAITQPIGGQIITYKTKPVYIIQLNY